MDELSPAKRRLLEQWLQARAASRATRAIPHAAPDSNSTWPVSFQQEDLCLRQWIEPDFTGFNNPKALRLRGPLHYQALKKGLAAVVARHAVLRTVYRLIDGEVRQQVMPMAPPELPVQVLNAPDMLQAERQSHSLALEFIRRPFDLSREFSLRAVLYQLAEHDHLLLIVVHHIASDLTSHQHLLNDLARGYRDAINGTPPPEPLSIQYTDYAVWQRRSYAAERLRLRSFWCKALQGASMLLPLGANSQALSAKESNVILHHWLVTESQLQAIDAMASRFHSSRFTVILSLVAHLLRQITQQDDFLLGVTVNHRSQTELEPLIGDLVDLLPLRLRFTEHLDDVGHGLQTTREALLEALDHRNMPFSELVRELQPQRQEGRMPLIQAAVTYSENQIVQPHWPELRVEAIELARDHMALDMHWAFQAVGNDLDCILECATQRLGGNTMADLPARFLSLLERVIRLASSPDDIQQPISRRHPHDYGVLERQRLRGDRLHQLKDYWVPQLTGLEALELPTDHPHPATPSHQGASHSFRIEPNLLAPFEELCRLEGATLQMGLLAVVALLLHRYSRQDDFAIGVPIWARNHADLEPLIGSFINTLPIRSRFSADLSFRQLLNQVKTTSINAYNHQDLPFEQMVEALNLERDTSRNPLVQVILQLIELPAPSLSNLDGLAVEPIQSSTTASRFDLEFFLRRDPDDGLKATVVFATDLFCADRIQRLASHLLSLLASAAQAPDLPAASLNLLPDAELQLIQSWQHGPTIDIPDLCVHQLFEQQVARTPDAIALIFEHQQLTYSQLNARANQLAHQLIDLDVGPDVIVAVCLERSIELIVALLAILKAGGAYLPLDPSWPQERRTLLLTDSGCAVLITAAGAQLLRVPAIATPSPALRPLAYISYTSGSTGTPKGVAIEHQAILRLVDPINGFRLGNGAAVLQLAPVAFDAATFEIWGPLLHGGTLVLAPPGTPSLAELAACLNQHRITTLWLTAGLFHATVDAELNALAAVPQVLAGGDVLHPASVRRLLTAFPPGHTLINGYGPTENTTFTCCQRLGSDAPLTTAEVPIGSPIANTTVRVLDPSGSPCPIGIPGELHISGAGLARGYLNNPELTAEKFIPDPFSDDPSARLYKSGDLASWNPDGTLDFHGRIDQQIKLRGFRIEPGEIEANLLAHPGVAQATIILRRDDPANPHLIAYWVPQQPVPSAEISPAETLPAEQLRTFLAQRLPDYMVPSAFVALPALPLTPNGKLDRRALPAPSLAGDLSQRVAPSTDLERQLHAIWAEVLGHSDFGITDNFFVIGGHSLLAASLIAILQNQLRSALTVPDVFRLPTIAQQVHYLQELDRESAGPTDRSPDLSEQCLVTLQPDGDLPPLYMIHGGFGAVGHFVPLARALGPWRPVMGLQAEGKECGEPVLASPREMAAVYADQILRHHPGGAIHLLGASAGGWYAHAVAEALLQRGAAIGVLAILDTHPGARLHRRVRWLMLHAELAPRLANHLSGLVRPPDGQRRSRFLARRTRALLHHATRYLEPNLPSRLGGGMPSPRAGANDRWHADPFVQLLRHEYRPARLAISVDLFATPRKQHVLRKMWKFYARGGVRLHQMFEDHADFFKPELMPLTAEVLAEILAGRDALAPLGAALMTRQTQVNP